MNSALRPCGPRTLQTYEKALNTARTFAYYYFTDAQKYGFRPEYRNEFPKRNGANRDCALFSTRRERRPYARRTAHAERKAMPFFADTPLRRAAGATTRPRNGVDDITFSGAVDQLVVDELLQGGTHAARRAKPVPTDEIAGTEDLRTVNARRYKNSPTLTGQGIIAYESIKKMMEVL